MQVTKMVPGAEEVQDSFHCTHPDFKLHESDFINRNTEELAAGAALTYTGDPMIGVPLMLAGGIGFGKSMFNKAHQHKTCYRTTSYSHSSAVEMTAVTERTYYLNPRIESAMGTPDERAAFGLTEVQLERWCRVATTEASCNSKYRHYGCNWSDGICKLRPVPICHTWHDDYPAPNSTADLEQCQPLDGFSPCVVIQQIYNESQGGNNKMLPVPGTGQYLTAHRVLGPYDQLLCVPLVHKVGVEAGAERTGAALMGWGDTGHHCRYQLHRGPARRSDLPEGAQHRLLVHCIDCHARARHVLPGAARFY